mgnify:CR=1 FL=1
MADRLGKTLRGYLAREITVGFAGGLALFTFILLTARIIDRFVAANPKLGIQLGKRRGDGDRTVLQLQLAGSADYASHQP